VRDSIAYGLTGEEETGDKSFMKLVSGQGGRVRGEGRRWKGGFHLRIQKKMLGDPSLIRV